MLFVRNAAAKIQMYIDHRNKRENEILSLVAEVGSNIGLSASDIVDTLYKGASTIIRVAALNNVKHHLKKLQKEGKIYSDDDKWLSSKL